MPRYAISDIHGCPKTFRKLLQEIDFNHDDELFLLGDYIDKGPDSMGVIESIWDLQECGHKVVCLKGNHEEMLLQAALGERLLYEWKPKTELFRAVINWLDVLPHYHLTPGYFLVHAGLNFRHEAPLEDTYSMLWIRDWYDEIDRDWLGDRIIVHGHTPEPIDSVRFGISYMDEAQRVCIDSGCSLPYKGFKHLTALNLDSGEGTFVRFCEY